MQFSTHKIFPLPQKPTRPFFSSGPCPKPNCWQISWLKDAVLGRSHRSAAGQARLQKAHKLTRILLNLPENYKLAFLPGGGTGAFEAALWNLLGAAPVNILVFDHFTSLWADDITKQLKLAQARRLDAPYGKLPKLNHLEQTHDLVFSLTGTSAGVRVPLEQISHRAENALNFIDGTAALFCEKIDWQKCDIFSFSWQKALGGEGGHGALILSPKAFKRLQNYSPSWPIPRLFALKENGHIKEELFNGSPINTPSLLCVEDYIKNLEWALKLGGYNSLVERSARNTEIVQNFLERINWATFLVTQPDYRAKSCTTIKIIDQNFIQYTPEKQDKFLKEFCKFLADQQVAFDISSYRHAPKGLRLWTGPTIEAQDLQQLCLWLDHAFVTVKNDFP